MVVSHISIAVLLSILSTATASCSGNFTGELCQECIAGMRGDQCDECIHNCPTCHSDADTCSFCVQNNASTICDCVEQYTGSDCWTYIGECPDNCAECVSHLQCLQCQPGYSGEQCETMCAQYCKDCTGFSAQECLVCMDNAVWGNNSECLCKPHWIGTTCEIYTGQCHPKCHSPAGWNGSTSYDCEQCVPNAEQDDDGKWECSNGWGGSDCTKYVLKPDMKCLKSSGPNSQDCIWCVAHAFRDRYGRCVCESFYSGNSWERYIGPCNSRCRKCSGPLENNCQICVDGASITSKGECHCHAGRTGERCEIETQYGGKCDSHCVHCTGASAFDCISCVENSTQTSSGECICDAFWVGDHCSIDTHFGGVCDPRCSGCTGPYNSDCLKCTQHAFMDYYGNCMCEAHWTGSDCSVSVLSRGSCDPKCNGCTGPSSGDCIECTANSSRDSYGNCVCDRQWTGDDCSIFSGICNPLCKDSCTGPLASNCISCIENATWDEFGSWACEMYWTNDNCTYYVGPCDSKCDSYAGCNGPSPGDCVQCAENSSRKLGECRCEEYWTGGDCMIYIGDCHGYCLGCTGISDSDCNFCVPNSHWSVFGRCSCDTDWSGSGCTVYHGRCDGRCIGCHGPSNADCDVCVSNSDYNAQGECVCYQDYSGEFCQKYQGNCDTRCSQCHGPTKGRCTKCVRNAVWSEAEDGCMCQSGWLGLDCTIWNGDCHDLCDDKCSGPGAEDCDACVKNAGRDSSGECKCLIGWGSRQCKTWRGFCHDSCVSCIGPSVNDCKTCSKQADLILVGLEAGHCQCKDGWTGPQCKLYGSLCPINCETCKNETQCINCARGAYRNNAGNCKCGSEDWEDDCTTYIGNCDSKCRSCSGPLPEECSQCLPNAYFDFKRGSCECAWPWGGAHCNLWMGQCHEVCDSCTGPTFLDCLNCKANLNTMMSPQGVCSCADEKYSGPLCAVFVGECDPICVGCSAPGAENCIECAANAVRDDAMRCVCEEGFASGTGCKEFDRMQCHPICDKALSFNSVQNNHPCPTGPTERDCHFCGPNSYRHASGICACLEDWTGADCQIYSGSCSPACEICDSPSKDCQRCVTNASQDFSGECHCHDSWSADAACSLYSGKCHHACSICDGPNEVDCISCSANSSWKIGHGCECLPDWNGQFCDTYGGLCDQICNPGHCFGPLSDECYECGDNAHFNNQNQCICNSSWTGNDCSLYVGDWAVRCTKCTGPSENDCTACIAHADSHRNCMCMEGYSGPFCDFCGTCAPTCASCFGPGASQCNSCVDNAYRNSEGSCECLPDWRGHDCSTFVASESVCDPKCNFQEGTICSGPLNTQCTSCRQHAHHADYDLDLGLLNDYNRGGCICDQYWLGDDCGLYAGPCDPRCASCSGPSNTECFACTEFASLYQHTCTCRPDSYGPKCEYSGSCDSKCDGCSGPGPSACITCVTNAFRDDDLFSDSYGECVCLGSYTGETCQTPGATCGDNCLICDPQRPDQCLRCSGSNALLPDHTCSPCPQECRECFDANSDGYLTNDECTACWAGNYVTTEGRCDNCSIRCKECNDGPSFCTACWNDSQLQGTTCECNESDGYYSHRAQGRCVRTCPTLFAHAAGECIHNGYAANDSSMAGVLGHYLSVHKLYIMETYNAHITVSETIHTHQFWFTAHDQAWFTEDRGFYFVGNKNVEIHNLIPYQTMTLVYWFNAFDSDVNLHFRQYRSWNSSDPQRTNTNKLIEPETVHTEHLWISECNELIIEALGIQVETDEYEYEGGWARLVVTFKSEWVEKTGTDISLILNDQDLGKGTSNYSVYQQWKSTPWVFGRGLLNHPNYNFNGFIYDVEYHPIVQPTNISTFGICSGCHFCPANNECLSTCDLNARYDADLGQCITCDDCNVGCREDGSCAYSCEDDCGSCSTQTHLCASCMANASIVNGSCQCDSHYTGEGKACLSTEHACDIQNCAACDAGREEKQCILCDEGFSAGRNECSKCTDSACDPYVDTVYRQPTGDCICEAWQYWDGDKCIDCSPDCNHCTATGPFNCTSCSKGFHFASGSDYCLEFCATGFFTHSTNKTCQGNPGVVVDFSFDIQNKVKWTYNGNVMHPQPNSWQILVYGGYNAETLDKTDPYITDDRGLWFDGKYTFLTLEGLVLHHSTTIEMWIKAHCSDGTLFSSSQTTEHVHSNTNIHFGISDTQLEFADTSRAMNLQNTENLEVYFWTHVAVGYSWDQMTRLTGVRIYNNGNLQGTMEYNGITIDFPDDTSVHRIGALEAQGHLFDLYRGFIYSFKVWNKSISNFVTSVNDDCGSACHFCPNVGMCLGVCNWNHYWNQSKCVRCPLWCEGCLQDGTCSAN